ncbi:hypothetical protein FFLO_05888 [Filobasidium floriforme]|uniref:J domain-containing protein n=1 Tax=Filobasidium floriforme TaxID=5210 RepID=A0A8K0JG09_9TREE|nr:hypothetical protein FFLO_05888 [Filobasidium floriforme]
MSTYNRITTRCLHTTRPARARIHDKQNHYDVLQVGRGSSKRDIKNRFYELSKKAHPDVPGGNRATFEKLSEAYSVLGDDSKRRQYDISLQPRSSSGVTHSTPYYSPHSPYLRSQRPGHQSQTGPHRAWAGTAKSTTGQGSTYSRPQNAGSWTDYGFAERTGGAAGRRHSGPPPQFGSGSHHPNLHRYPFGGRSPGSGSSSTQGGGGGGGLGDDGGEEIRKDSGVLRFFGVLAMLMTVIGLGGGFNARADERPQGGLRNGDEVWSSDGGNETDGRMEIETRWTAAEDH